MLDLLAPRPNLDARDVTGNVVLGVVHGDVIQNFFAGVTQPSEPVLNWLGLQSPAGEPNVSRLLSWRTRLVKLLGREEPRLSLLEWAHRGDPVRVRLLSGPGGAGKSRLAAEVADHLRKEGWTAGFSPPGTSAILPLRDKGLFLIIDYPEERRHQIRMFLQDAAVLEAPPASIRILLVSRQPASWWRGDVDAAHADVLCDAQEIGIARLGREAAVGVFREAAQRLASHFKRNISSAPDAEISSWQNRDAALHCLPLFVLGAAIHWVLEANPILGIAGGKIVESLVDREIKRLNNAARAAQWGEESGARLVGLATIRGGLDADSLRHLAEPKFELEIPKPDRIVDAVRALGWWHEDNVPALAPDIVGAVLLLKVLDTRRDLASEWLWAAIEGSGDEL